MQSYLKLTFVSEKHSVKRINNKMISTVYSGFKFSKLDGFFDQFGYLSLPPSVENALFNNGYRRDYNLGMWVIKSVGVSECSKDDEFDETKGRRIATSRAKVEAFKTAENTMDEILRDICPIADVILKTSSKMVRNKVIEQVAIRNVIATGISDPLNLN